MKCFSVKKVERPTYSIDRERYKRFDQRETVFGRMLLDENAPFFKRGMYDKVVNVFKKKEKGYSRFDFARTLGAWTVYDYFHGAFSHTKLTGANNVMQKPALPKIPCTDPAELTREIKKTAGLYGASLVGICELNHDWVYSHTMEGQILEISDRCRYAIVIGIAMDPYAIQTSPAYPACVESGKAYSRMAFSVSCIAEFIRYLGYDAIPMGNDTALSIPLAIDAGLGELGRHGLLITPQFGPCLRLCKVFTNIPLVPDKPITFGVTEFCRKCNKCAEACEVEAIQKEREPSRRILCPSNNTGVVRWAVNHDECYRFWIENGGDCSKCIAACPYTPGEKTR